MPEKFNDVEIRALSLLATALTMNHDNSIPLKNRFIDINILTNEAQKNKLAIERYVNDNGVIKSV